MVDKKKVRTANRDRMRMRTALAATRQESVALEDNADQAPPHPTTSNTCTTSTPSSSTLPPSTATSISTEKFTRLVISRRTNLPTTTTTTTTTVATNPPSSPPFNPLPPDQRKTRSKRAPKANLHPQQQHQPKAKPPRKVAKPRKKKTPEKDPNQELKDLERPAGTFEMPPVDRDSNYVAPGQIGKLRACMICSYVQTYKKFAEESCPNCDDIPDLDYREAVDELTSPVYEGMIILKEPTKSWVARWQRVNNFRKGVYAVKVVGNLPDDLLAVIEKSGVSYKPRDGSYVLED